MLWIDCRLKWCSNHTWTNKSTGFTQQMSPIDVELNNSRYVSAFQKDMTYVTYGQHQQTIGVSARMSLRSTCKTARSTSGLHGSVPWDPVRLRVSKQHNQKYYTNIQEQKYQQQPKKTKRNSTAGSLHWKCWSCDPWTTSKSKPHLVSNQDDLFRPPWNHGEWWNVMKLPSCLT